MPFQYTFRSDDIQSLDEEARDLLENRDRELELYSTILEQSTIPIGAITIWAGLTTALPVGYLLCDGTGYLNTSTYLPLFNVIGYMYGGSGATFNVPTLMNTHVPLSTTTQNTALSRNANLVPTSLTSTSGHAHSFGNITTNTTSLNHDHAQNAVNTNTQSANHRHGVPAVNTGFVSNDHQHNFSVNSGNDSVNHTHFYFKGGTGDNTGGSNAFHKHEVSGGTSGINTNHFHTTNASTSGFIDNDHAHSTLGSTTGGQSNTHTHSSTAVVNSTTTDTAHLHGVPGPLVVYIIKYL